MITKDTCECCDDTTYHIELDAETAVTYNGSEFTLHLLREEMEELYHALKEELLYNSWTNKSLRATSKKSLTN